MKIDITNTKYEIKTSNKFDKQLKKAVKQNKNIEKMITVLELLADGKMLDAKYKNHKLFNNKIYKDCYECHIEPDWLLVYKIYDDKLILLLFATGSHSELFEN